MTFSFYSDSCLIFSFGAAYTNFYAQRRVFSYYLRDGRVLIILLLSVWRARNSFLWFSTYTHCLIVCWRLFYKPPADSHFITNVLSILPLHIFWRTSPRRSTATTGDQGCSMYSHLCCLHGLGLRIYSLFCVIILCNRPYSTHSIAGYWKPSSLVEQLWKQKFWNFSTVYWSSAGITKD